MNASFAKNVHIHNSSIYTPTWNCVSCRRRRRHSPELYLYASPEKASILVRNALLRGRLAARKPVSGETQIRFSFLVAKL